MKNKKILFILKFREGYNGPIVCDNHYVSSGLYWSARFVSDMLDKSGIEAKLVQVVDNNDIDREVSIYKPDIVVIEALWVVPEKFKILKKLHPRVKWVVRLHSNVPFLSNEGIAVEWIKGYEKESVYIAVNDKLSIKDLETITGSEVAYLPNYYPIADRSAERRKASFINIACYGAIRPLKNQLIQAISAIRFANSIKKKLYFHINASRVEMGGDSVLRNLQALFKNTRHELIEDRWMSHDNFLDILKRMDIGMQVSLTETFSIVSADMVSVGIPIVVSNEVEWASNISKVKTTDSDSIVNGLNSAYNHPELNIVFNRVGLKNFSGKSKKVWLNFIKEA